MFTTSRRQAPRPGVIDDDRVIDLGAAGLQAANLATMLRAQSFDRAHHLLAAARRRSFALCDVLLHSPLHGSERNIFAVGWNYQAHFEEAAQQRAPVLPERPTFFSKSATSIRGPYDDLVFDPAVSACMDWEVELAVVIGKAGRNIPESRALRHIFGCVVVNDISARDLHFQVPRLIAELSMGMTLLAGDVIATGTPMGVGFARDPAEYLRNGDLLETEVTGIGSMSNRIRYRSKHEIDGR